MIAVSSCNLLRCFAFGATDDRFCYAHKIALTIMAHSGIYFFRQNIKKKNKELTLLRRAIFCCLGTIGLGLRGRRDMNLRY